MNTGEVIQSVLALFGGVGAAVLVVTFLSKKIVAHLLEKDLDRHKSNLQHQTAIEIEKIRHKNERTITEFKESISNLSQKRIEAIELVAVEILDIYATIQMYAPRFFAGQNDSPAVREERISRESGEMNKVMEQHQVFFERFKKVEIYLPSDLSDKILEFRNTIFTLAKIPTVLIEMGAGFNFANSQANEWRGKYAQLDGQYKAIKEDLRKLIGVFPRESDGLT